jgi:mannose-6-phosphate isomerase-like protein (cupin superfamily)
MAERVEKKEAARQRSRKWYAANKAKADTKTRAWQAANKDKTNASARKYRQTHKEQARENCRKWRVNNRAKLGLPEPTRAKPDFCEACGGPPNGKGGLHLDHCHKTGVFRGWLCASCNVGVGMLGDNRKKVLQAARYLAKVENDFESVSKNWGHEELIYNGAYCFKKLVYEKAIASSLHYHLNKHETFVVQDGEFELELVGSTRMLQAMDYVVLPPMTPHRIRCFVQGTILEVSSHDDSSDCVRLIPSET